MRAAGRSNVQAISLTQENAVDLVSVFRVSLSLATMVGEWDTDCIINMGLHHFMTFFPVVAFVSFLFFFITSLKSNLCIAVTTQNIK